MRNDDRVKQWVKQKIVDLQAYPVPLADGLIKIDAMENPYSWPESLTNQWLAELKTVPLNRYPDPAAENLKERLREVMAIPEASDIMLGNGSDELIQIIAMALAKPGGTLIAPEPSFVMYRMIATFAGLQYVGVPLRADFSLDMTAMQEAIQRYQPAVVFLAYPNNPTGNLFAERDIGLIIEAAPGVVVIDEAYHAFAGRSFLAHLASYPHLLVMRTFSKMGLAGLRLGFLAGNSAWLEQFEKIRLPYNINVLTQVSVDFALRHQAVFEQQARQIKTDREAMYAALALIDGVETFKSEANFILFRVADGLALQVFDELRAHGLLIKNLHGSLPSLAGCLRVTIGTPDENAAFITAMQQIIDKVGRC